MEALPIQDIFLSRHHEIVSYKSHHLGEVKPFMEPEGGRNRLLLSGSLSVLIPTSALHTLREFVQQGLEAGIVQKTPPLPVHPDSPEVGRPSWIRVQGFVVGLDVRFLGQPRRTCCQCLLE